jgi:phytanoyl-CoA hydroxylase
MMEMPRDTILIRPAGERADAYPLPSSTHAFRAYFEQEGFIVVRNAISKPLCEAAKQAFLTEILPAKHALFVRHASGAHERHVYTEHGFMKFPVMNIQDVPDRRYPGFRRNGLALLTDERVQRAISALFGEAGQIVYTMYFDGNQTTWSHRDGHYFDSQQSGAMVGVWIAAEDIHPDAGRFFVVPRSHRIGVLGEQQDPNGRDYKSVMADFVRHGPLDCVAPILQQGDMLLWSSMTIHGSLPSANASWSRRSFTGHYVPQSHQFKRHLVKNAVSRTILVNGVPVASHADRSALGMLKESLRVDFPRVYMAMRRTKAAIAGH